ncbi:MAG TPA: DUF4019 domain-containing protein [Geobacteraceae bacterium]
MKALRLLVVVAFVLCFAAIPVLAGSANEKAALASARAWLSLIDNGQYAESWKEASAYFRGAVGEEAWKESLAGVRGPLGKVVSRAAGKAREATQLPAAPDGTYVVMQFTTSFEHKKRAIETVTFVQEQGGRWRAAGYFIK